MISLLANIGAACIWHVWLRQRAAAVRAAEVGTQKSDLDGFCTELVSSQFCVAKKSDGSYIFYSNGDASFLSLAYIKEERDKHTATSARFVVSSHNMFVSWRQGTNGCEDVVLQYNDNESFRDKRGGGEVTKGRKDPRLFWADRARK
ncbi:MAG: hypothetical protein ACI4RD_07440 [Kiritimatiellia bacterium]